MPYGIGVGCDGIDIQRLVGEAWFLMRQAAKVLDEVIENRATEVCRRAVLNILNTLVGTAAAGDPQTHIYIRNRFVEATNGIGAPGARGANIVIHCRDPEITRTYTIAGQPTTINVHPVPMARINGVPQPGSPPFLFGNSGGQLYYFVQTEPDSTIAGYTLVMEPGSDIMQGQQQHTGSSVVWSDVVLKSALAPNPTGFRSLERVTDWTPAGLMGRGLGLLDLGDLPFTTIIHELMHSTALANPIVGHGQVGGQSANGIASILQLATANDPLAASNPETFAFLAIGK
ncbi:MAG: hypothetical protein M1840_005540 [Geoglossum simile]|nr:MAG: hypothetical protein M1840_005540 [Geoglossum simile]